MSSQGRAPTKNILTNFASNTSAHGISKLTDKNGILLKLMWLLLLLGATGMIVYQVFGLINQYKRRPVNTQTSIENTQLTFPSVTMCNLNPVLNSEASKYNMYHVIERVAKYLNVPLSDFTNTDAAPSSDNYNFSDVNFQTDDPLDESILEFQLEMQSFSFDGLEEISQKFESFVISCTFGGVDCDNGNFTVTFDQDYGLCYTFPSKSENQTQGNFIFNAGPLYGLKLILNVDQNEYLPFITTSAGVRLQIHEFGSRPYMLELGQSLSTGFETQIGVKPVVYKRQPHPYGTCDDSGKYESVLECERNCLATLIEDSCGCTRQQQQEDDPDLEMCGSKNIPCIKDIIKEKQSGKIKCDVACRSTCRVYDFQKQVSMTRWPANHYDPAIKFKVRKWAENFKTDVFNDENSRDNLLSINVYFSELSLQTIEEEPAYEFASLLSDFGGQLGLWMGISVLSICEVLELFYLLMANCFKPRPRVSSSSVTDLKS
ncbi:amiloride-sensitive sodium channel subunit gamma-like [Haliotis rubra]|uniref:amiloride-sensitive sodium channel subunit gamma-like n=1 Tax=Haliotis rubra TaxID=36100 RepID=UPI001EE582A1|nr:amiloride-sensitive sodium channel subunit gamma-like [Haliotis rubra]XP_046578814.1 amiloride-sensitive sodium channel subunit gamma-like [Haliotis rubra]